MTGTVQKSVKGAFGGVKSQHFLYHHPYADDRTLIVATNAHPGCFESLHEAFVEHLQYVVDIALTGLCPTGAQINLPLFALRYIKHEHQLAKALLGKRSGGAPLLSR